MYRINLAPHPQHKTLSTMMAHTRGKSHEASLLQGNISVFVYESIIMPITIFMALLAL